MFASFTQELTKSSFRFFFFFLSLYITCGSTRSCQVTREFGVEWVKFVFCWTLHTEGTLTSLCKHKYTFVSPWRSIERLLSLVSCRCSAIFSSSRFRGPKSVGRETGRSYFLCLFWITPSHHSSISCFR